MRKSPTDGKSVIAELEAHGYAVVPVEPTEAMIDRGMVALDAIAIGIQPEDWLGGPTGYTEGQPQQIWRTMLIASQKSLDTTS